MKRSLLTAEKDSMHERYQQYSGHIDFSYDRAGGARNPSPPILETLQSKEYLHGGDCHEDPTQLTIENLLLGPRRPGTVPHHIQESITPLCLSRGSSSIFKPVAVRPNDPKDLQLMLDGVLMQNANGDEATRALEKGPENQMTPVSMEEKSSANKDSSLPLLTSITKSLPTAEVVSITRDLLSALVASKGDTNETRFKECLSQLRANYLNSSSMTALHSVEHSSVGNLSKGMWLNLAKPLFPECLGANESGDPLYTLSRMLGIPTVFNVICSLQATYNSVCPVEDAQSDPNVPNYIKDHLLHKDEESDSPTNKNEKSRQQLCTYDMVTSFTVEPSHVPLLLSPPPTEKSAEKNAAKQCSVQAILNFKGYSLPDPIIPQRHTVWLAEGCVQTVSSQRQHEVNWKRVFSGVPAGEPAMSSTFSTKPPVYDFLDSDSNGAPVGTNDHDLAFRFQCPFGGPGVAHVDTLYIDDSLRIVQGHRGSLFVFSKVPEDTLNMHA